MRTRVSGSRLGTIGLALALAALASCAEKAPRPPKEKFPGMTARQIYEVAYGQIKKKKYSRARDTLQSALGRQDTTPEVTALVHLALADAYFLDGGIINLAEAQSRYTNFVTFYPNHDRADYAQYQIGLCHLKQALNPDRDQSQTRKALLELQKVEDVYPNSAYVDEAFAKADEARERIAEHGFRIGYFYYRKEAFEGAVSRLRVVLEEFPRYSRKDRLYLVLGKSLIALSKEDEGDLYLKKLVAEFPASPYVPEARSLLERHGETIGGGR